MDEDDLTWAVERVERAAASAEAWLGTSGYNRDERAARRRAFSEALGVALPILERLAPERARAISSASDGQYLADNLRIATEQLRTLPEVERRLGPQGPRLAAARLHPVVWGACLSLWGTHHYRQAVSAAAQAVNAHLQDKLERRDVSERDAVAQAFSIDEPREGQPRLRFPEFDRDVDPDTWESRHNGAKFLGMGLFAGIRNVLSHGDPSNELDPDLALEYLAALSVFARWVEEAVRVQAPPRTAPDVQSA